MAGPLTIQRTPRGLLDWLGMKGSGQGPTELSAAVVPVVQIGALYLQDRLQSRTELTATTLSDGFQTSSNTNFTVPAGEVWLPSLFSMNMTTGTVGLGFTMQLAVRRNVGNRAYIVDPTAIVVPLGGEGSIGKYWSPGELILNPGDAMGLMLTAGTYVVAPLSLNFEYYRIII